MDMWIVIYRGETYEDEIEISIRGIYRVEDDELEILEVVNSYTDEQMVLTAEELERVQGEEVDRLLVGKGRSDLVERRHSIEPMVESHSEKIVRALNKYARFYQ